MLMNGAYHIQSIQLSALTYGQETVISHDAFV